MSFAWEGFLAVGQELVTCPGLTAQRDARERACVGRVYYAVFGRALRVMVACGQYRKQGDGLDHTQLEYHLEDSEKPQWKQLAQYLRRLKAARTWADYQDGAPDRRAAYASSPESALRLGREAMGLLDAIERGH